MVTGQLEDTRKSECFYMGTQIATATLGDKKVTMNMMFNNVIQVSGGGHYNVNFDIRTMVEEAVTLIKEAERGEVK